MKTQVMAVGWFIKILLLVTIISLKGDINNINHSCNVDSVAESYGIKGALIRAIIDTERKNINSIDRAQDIILNHLLKTKNNSWWENWAESNDSIANSYFAMRCESGKWPTCLYSSLYVVSIGDAQITPRTILNVLRSTDNNICVKNVMTQLLTKCGSVELMCEVLCYQIRSFDIIDITDKPDIQGTLYNFGLDLYQYLYQDSIIVNDFGKQVLIKHNEYNNSKLEIRKSRP